VKSAIGTLVESIQGVPKRSGHLNISENISFTEKCFRQKLYGLKISICNGATFCSDAKAGAGEARRIARFRGWSE